MVKHTKFTMTNSSRLWFIVATQYQIIIILFIIQRLSFANQPKNYPSKFLCKHSSSIWCPSLMLTQATLACVNTYRRTKIHFWIYYLIYSIYFGYFFHTMIHFVDGSEDTQKDMAHYDHGQSPTKPMGNDGDCLKRKYDDNISPICRTSIYMSYNMGHIYNFHQYCH